MEKSSAIINSFVDRVRRFASVHELFVYGGKYIVALSGGVFLNRYLMEHAVSALVDAGFTVALNREVPPSDGCISLGQAVIACATSKQTAE